MLTRLLVQQYSQPLVGPDFPGTKIKGTWGLEILVSADFVEANHRMERLIKWLGVHCVFILILTQFSWVTKIFLIFYYYAFSGGRTDQRCTPVPGYWSQTHPFPPWFPPCNLPHPPLMWACPAGLPAARHLLRLPSAHQLHQSAALSASLLVSHTLQPSRSPLLSLLLIPQ